MIGNEGQPGVVPRAIDRIYEVIDRSASSDEWNVYLTYVELYNDGFRDLLAPSSQPGQRLVPARAEEVRREQAAIVLRETQGQRGALSSFYLSGSSTFRTPVGSRSELETRRRYRVRLLTERALVW